MNPVSDLLKARSHDVAACLRQDFDDEILVQVKEHYNLLSYPLLVIVYLINYSKPLILRNLGALGAASLVSGSG